MISRWGNMGVLVLSILLNFTQYSNGIFHCKTRTGKITSAPSYVVTPWEHPQKMVVWHLSWWSHCATGQNSWKVSQKLSWVHFLCCCMEQCLNSKVGQETFGSGAVFMEVHTGICPTPAGFMITGQCGQHTIIIYTLGVWVGIQNSFDTNQSKLILKTTKLTLFTFFINVSALIVHVSSAHVTLQKNKNNY